jgi:hypothetical protein
MIVVQKHAVRTKLVIYVAIDNVRCLLTGQITLAD